MIRALAAGCLAAVTAVGQGRIEIRLPADPDRSGPAALVWARGVLHEFDPAAPAPFGALALTLDDTGLRVRQDGATDPVAGALWARITVDGSAIEATCDARGLETWRAPREALLAPPLQALATQLDLARAPGPVWLDVAALIGGRATGVQMESPLGRLLTLGAVECGDLIVQLHTEGDEILVRGRSRGGLTLPAVLLHLAARKAPRATPVETWRALAFAARDSRREEAALHLAFGGGRLATDALRSLLFARDAAQGRAAEALARRGDPEALALVASALRSTSAAQRPALETSFATLWTLAPPDARRRARTDAPAASTAALVEPAPKPPAVGALAARLVAVLLLLVAAAFLASALLDRSPRRA